MKKVLHALTAVATAGLLSLLAACGESTTENVTQINEMGMDVVKSVKDLPKCTSENQGEQAFVKGETSARICVDGKWFATVASDSSADMTCTTKALKDKSGVKIICGGDSVGVVLNGKDGADGKDGKNGADGKDGVQGIQGEKGDKGDAGADGAPGTNGKNGSDGAPGENGTSCTAVTLKDNSGLKILCGGDSVGVVLNGQDGAKGDPGESGTPGTPGEEGQPGAGCSVISKDCILHVACGADTVSLDLYSTEDACREIVEIDSEKIAVSLDEVSGVTQKGPFLMGSRMLVREMEDGRTLTQTGGTFNGKILNDNGEFKINARMLVSQYVMLEATGYYRNEVTGKNSNSELTLFAITDVNERNVVNVNLLTHLEYDRVIYLVTQKKMKVRDAKKQAQTEVFGLLNIDATKFSNSEDLNIAGASDEDGALLAYSLMFQGNRSAADLTVLLQTISNDMKEDGTWDDKGARMEIAEWSADADSSGRLAEIRRNVEGWGLSLKVPNFEQFVRNFWNIEYGLDSCNAKNEGVVKAAMAGKQKGTKTRYICKDDGSDNLRWQIASDFEKDTYQWADTTDGALKNGDVTGKVYVFDSTGSFNGTVGWRVAESVEMLYGGCRVAVYGVIRRDSKNGGFYQCQEELHKWILVNNNLLIDTQQWTEGEDGFSKWGDSIGVVTSESRICYVYDTSSAYNGWRTGNVKDCTLGLLGCTAGRAGRMQLAKDENFYNCANNVWTQVDDRVRPNTIGWACLDSNDGEMKLGLYDTDVYFVCEAHAWREASHSEEIACRSRGLCNACTDILQGFFWKNDEEKLVCDGKNWRYPNCAESLVEKLCTANDSSIVRACDRDYVCSSEILTGKLSWHEVLLPFEYTLADWDKKKAEYFANDNLPEGLAYGEDLEDNRDGNVYKTVVVNGKRWMAENLRYVDNDPRLKGQTWCYNGEEKNCEIGGRMYSWTAAMYIDYKWQESWAGTLLTNPHQGVCPNGWHIPNDEEWSNLFSLSYSGPDYQFTGIWNSASEGKGFFVLPTEILQRITDDEEVYEVVTSFWMPGEYEENKGAFVFGDWTLVIGEQHYASTCYGSLYCEGYNMKGNQMHVRCVQNDPVEP